MKRLLPTSIVAALVALIAIASGSAASHGTVRCVGGPHCYTSIQAAVDAAADGDTIAVGRGTFAGGVTITKSVALTRRRRKRDDDPRRRTGVDDRDVRRRDRADRLDQRRHDHRRRDELEPRVDDLHRPGERLRRRAAGSRFPRPRASRLGRP